ncbi:MAG: hypothetical protein OSA99_15930 [Acidimicrobiales bacterium]|nr:hypothetical protein [Acidimicrobiales bacterium]
MALIGTAVALLAATVAVVNTRDPADSDSSSSTTSVPSETTASAPPTVELDDLSGAARDLATLLAAGRETTYHARYSGRSAADGTGGTLILESWSKDGRFRQDTIVDVADESFHRSNFLLDERAVACTRLGAADWTCDESPAEQFQGADVLGGGSLDQLARAAVGEEPGEVGGREARCFVITLDTQTTELCTTDEGVPLRIRSQTSELVLEVLDHDVDDGVFDPPATPSPESSEP